MESALIFNKKRARGLGAYFVVLFVPIHKFRHTLVDRGFRLKSGKARGFFDIGKCLGDISRLHGQ